MLYDSNSQRKNIILNMINHLGPISRTALIDLTGFRPATVGAIAGELLEENLIVETENVSVGHGRKRVLLNINSSHICSIGISFSPHNFTFIVSQFDGQILHKSKLPFDSANLTEEQVHVVLSHLQQLLKDFAHKNLVGIGLCKFFFDSTLRMVEIDRWIREQVMPRMESITTLPIQIFSEVTLPTVAEHRFGVAKGKENFIWVNLTDTIQVSLFCDGHAIGGARKGVGQLGHTVIDMNSKELCTCGKPGCLEVSSAWPALRKQILDAVLRGTHTCLKAKSGNIEDFTYRDVRAALDQGDRMCTFYTKEAAHRIGLALANVVNLLNPEMIVLHGYLLLLGKTFIEEMERTIRDNALPVCADFSTAISNSFENPMLLGAVAGIFSSYLHADDYRWVYQLSAESHN